MAPEAESRRQRLRRELTAEVIATARQQLREGGPAGVSWRGIARSVGVNPASLYTYFDSLDDVFTAVISDSFERLGQAVQEAVADTERAPSVDQLIGLAKAFRRWAVAHPAEFNLVFTDQLPGYAAPPEGPTVAAQRAIFGPFANALTALSDTALTDTALTDTALTDTGATPAGAAGGRSAADDQRGLPELPEDPSGFIGLWATMHGLVMLEINHHLPFIDDHETVFVDAMHRALSAWRA